MPLLSPSQIYKVLQEERSPAIKASERKLDRLLAESNLTAPEVLDNLSSLMRCGESDAVKLKAAETALKLNGLLEKDFVRQDMSVTIIINDSFHVVNPILIPRTI